MCYNLMIKEYQALADKAKRLEGYNLPAESRHIPYPICALIISTFRKPTTVSSTTRMQQSTVHVPTSLNHNIWIHTYLTKLLGFEISICPWCVNECDDGKPMMICIFHHPQSLPITNIIQLLSVRKYNLPSSIQYNQRKNKSKLPVWTLVELR